MTFTAVGLDISVTATGIVRSDGLCKTVGQAGITLMQPTDKIGAIDQLSQTIGGFIGRPSLVVMEKWAISRTAGGVFERLALQWQLMCWCMSHGIPFMEVSSGQLKVFATGNGRSGKGNIIEAVTRRWPEFETGGDDNICDALVLMAMGMHLLGEPIKDMPVSHTRALEGLTLPSL